MYHQKRKNNEDDVHQSKANRLFHKKKNMNKAKEILYSGTLRVEAEAAERRNNIDWLTNEHRENNKPEVEKWGKKYLMNFACLKPCLQSVDIAIKYVDITVDAVFVE